MLASEADRSSSPLLAQFLNTNRRRSKNLATVALGIALITFFLLWQSSSLDGYAVYVPATQQDDGSLVAHQEHDAANAVAHHDHEHHEEAPTPAAASSSAASAAPATAQTASGTSPITGHLIPPKIWQILLPQKAHTETAPVNPEQLQDTPSWLALNRDYLYTLVGHRGSRDFLRKNFADNKKVLDTYNAFRNVGMKSDLLRYLILSVEGGVYTDTDTVALKSIEKWVPAELRDQVRLVVGIEFDRRDGGPWADIAHWVQFCQWTIAAAPGHPVFDTMVNRIIKSAEELEIAHNISLPEITPSSFEVMNSTGPAAWTEVVFEHLQRADPTLNHTQDLSFMTEPKLYGDILVLTIDGFGMGQQHSASTNDGSIPNAALVKHLFRGSWRDT
jgi:alpha 1,6-mannosyltransferase